MRWVVALFCVIGCSLPQEASAAGIIVNRDPGLSARERADIRSDAGVTLDRPLPLPHVELVTAPDERAEQALATLNADPDVRFAVPDVPVRSAATLPTDPKFPSQWALENRNDADVDAPLAWDYSEGSAVTVAVADQRVNTAHPDLVAKIDPLGEQDFTQQDACLAGNPTGNKDHGTLVAGTIAAEHDNGVAIAGLAPLAKILPLRTLDNCGGGELSWVLEAFDYAGDKAIPIVTASLGTDPLLSPEHKAYINTLIADVLADQEHQKTLYVVAAGNEGNNNDERPVYPCNTLLPNSVEPDKPLEPSNLVCVGMTNQGDEPVCWGNVGEQSVDTFAPGTGILSTATGGLGWASQSGTSMATPMVAAVAALLKSKKLSYGPFDIKNALIESGKDEITALANISVSGGRLNAARTVDEYGEPEYDGPNPSTPWETCDHDHDGASDSVDQCLDQPGTVSGCPDADGDGLRDTGDNCPTERNADQADADGDRVGDACDGTPRGDDVDRDAKGALDDRCPNEPSPAADGCPVVVVNPPQENPPAATPTPTPAPAVRIVSLGLTVTPNACPKRDPKCARTAKVTIKVSREAKVSVKVEKRVKKKARWVWQRVSSKSLTATVRGKSVTVRGKRGRAASRYRMTATLAGAAKAVSFRV